MYGGTIAHQAAITWSLLVTSHHIHGAGLSRMADNSGHEAPAPDILGWAGHLTGSFTRLVNGGRGWGHGIVLLLLYLSTLVTYTLWVSLLSLSREANV